MSILYVYLVIVQKEIGDIMKYYMDNYLKKNLEMAKKVIKKDWDNYSSSLL